MQIQSGCLVLKAMNPCPYGYLGDTLRECRCTPQQVARYRDRLSGPLRDRLDLVVDVPALPAETLTIDANGEPSAVVRQRVVDARARAVAPTIADLDGADGVAADHLAKRSSFECRERKR